MYFIMYVIYFLKIFTNNITTNTTNEIFLLLISKENATVLEMDNKEWMQNTNVVNLPR